jgi:hypothetical protein
MPSRLSQIVLSEDDARALAEWFESGLITEWPIEVGSARLSILAQLRNLDGRRHNIPFVDPRR